MPLFATCTIANAILALCAPPGALTFSSWVLAQSLCASMCWPAPGWHAGFLVLAAARCVLVCGRNAGGSACLMACHAAALVCAVPGRRSGASVRLLVWPRNFGRDLPRLPCAELSMRTISMDLTRHWRPGMAQRTRRVDSTVAAAPPIAFRTACVMFAPGPQGSAPRCGLPPLSSTLRTIALQIYNNVCAGTCSCKIVRLISFAGHALTSSTILSVRHNNEIKGLQAIMKAKSQDISRALLRAGHRDRLVRLCQQARPMACARPACRRCRDGRRHAIPVQEATSGLAIRPGRAPVARHGIAPA